MGEYKHQDRKLRVNTPLGPDELLLTGFWGTEEISTLFGYRLEMLAENKTKVAFDAILGQKVTVYLALADGSETYLNGLCVKLTQGGRNDLFTEYEAALVPDVWRLTRKAQSRIFQRMTVPEILKKVFAGYTVDWQLNGKYEPRDYCVQYRETDFNFGARLMEEEGIYFFFEHSDGDHKMIAADDAMDHPDLAGENKFIYEEVEGGVRDENRIWAWKKEQEIRSGKFLLWDHCFELPYKHLEAEALITASVPVGKETHKLKVKGVDQMEVYDFPGEYAQRFDGINKGGGEQASELQKIFHDNERTVEIRMDEETTPAVVIRAKSNVKHLVPGYKFTLQRHFNADGEYVLTSVRHAATCGAGYRSGEEAALTYENEATCIPAALPYRPRRTTSKPIVQGSQTAIVVGPSGEEIFTDKYGRVKVQFHWDREGKNDENSSCWMRVGTSWAGREWGAIRIPRIGHEVIVDFLEGDPDQPIIVGSVYNADMMPPYELPKNKTQSGVKSRSSLKGGVKNYNEFRFEDKKGKELVNLHAERNLATTVENDESRGVGHDRATEIGHDDTLHVKNDETISVDHDRIEVVGNDETVLIKGNRLHNVKKDDGLVVSGDRGRKVIIEKGDDILQIDQGNQEIWIKQGDRVVKIDQGSDRLIVGKGDRTIAAPLGEVNISAKKLKCTATEKITLQCGASSIEMTVSSIEIRSPMTTVEGTSQVTVTGAVATLRGTGTVTVEGGATATVRAGLVKINC